MKEKVKEFVKSITNGNSHRAKNQFESLVRLKIRDRIEEKRVEVAQSIYNEKE